MDLFPSNVLGGVPSGCMSLRVKETPQLVEAQKRLNEELFEQFGPCPAEYDNDYVFHMTFAIGGASFEAYQKAHEALMEYDYKKSFIFNKVVLLYYDDDNYMPGTYFCYKICMHYSQESRHLWCRGYFVDTVGKNAKKIQEYIQNQLKEDWEYDQMTLREYMEPFTGEPVKQNK